MPYVFISTAREEKITTSNSGADAEKLSNSYIAGGDIKWYSHWKTV